MTGRNPASPFVVKLVHSEVIRFNLFHNNGVVRKKGVFFVHRHVGDEIKVTKLNRPDQGVGKFETYHSTWCKVPE